VLVPSNPFAIVISGARERIGIAVGTATDLECAEWSGFERNGAGKSAASTEVGRRISHRSEQQPR
jgi:hypothetical protein